MSCPHGEADPSCCIDCLEGPPAPRARQRARSTREIEARYATLCALNAGHRIEPGDTIRETADGWVCVECANPPT